MDATHFSPKTLALLLLTALIFAVPGFAAPNFVISNTSPVLSGTGGIPVTVGSDGDPITFTVSYPSTTGSGTYPVWLSVSPTSATTSATLNLSLANQFNTTAPVTVTLHATTPPTGVPDATLAVTFSGGGGGGQGATISPNPMTFSASPGFMAATQILTITPPAPSQVNVEVTSGSPWLTVPSLGPQNQPSATVTIQADATLLTTGIYYGTLRVTVGSTQTNVPVTFNVGTGGSVGSLNFSPSTLALYYTSGVAAPTGTIFIQSIGATASTYTATPSSSGWLMVGTTSGSGTTSAITGIPFSGGGSTLYVSVNPAGLATNLYTGTIAINASDDSAGTITVTLSVNGGSTLGVTITPNPVTLCTPVGYAVQTATVTVSGSGITGVVATGATNYSWLQTSVNGSNIIVQANPAPFSSQLAAGTYTGNFLVSTYGNVTNQNVSVVFTVGATSCSSGGGGGNAGAAGVAPASLTFAFQRGSGVNLYTIQPQAITVAGGGGTFTASVSSGNNFLAIDKVEGTTPATVLVTVVNVASLSAGIYNGGIQITNPNGSIVTVPVTVNVSSTSVVIAQPGSINLSMNGTDAATTRAIYLWSSDGTTTPFTVATSSSWLSVTPTSGSSTGGSQVPVTVTINPSGLSTGVYSGNVTVTSSVSANSPFNVPVVLIVNGGTTGASGPLTLTPTALSFNIAAGGASAAQSLNVTAASQTFYTVTTTGTWLSASLSSGTTGITPALTITAIPTGLATGVVYNGSVNFVANGQTQTVPVTLNLGTSGGQGGNVAVTPTSLSYTYQQGGSAPGVQGLAISSTGAAVSFTMAATTQSGGNWLSVPTTSQLTTPFTASIAVSVTGLAAGTYTGAVVITPTGGTQVSVPVTLEVNSLTVSATPTTLSYTYRTGDANPAAQTVSVAGGGSTLTFTAVASSNGGWLSVSPASDSTPSSVSVSVDGSSLNAGTYTGTVTIAGSGTATGSTTITVTVTVTAPLPTITSVKNAGSFATGGVSPGEIVSLFGTNMGPTTPATATLDSTTGKLSTTNSGVQVFFNGVAAPLAYVSSTQINAVVPYELAGRADTFAEVRYRGQGSNNLPLQVVTTAPALFTLNGSGTGPGAILNSDSITINGAASPAQKGSTIVLYGTGEGQTSPFGVTGKIGPVTGVRDLPVPLLPVAITIDGQPANYSFAGGAPGFVAGLLQINVQIPLNVRSGDVPVVVRVGNNSSQSGVTVSVR